MGVLPDRINFNQAKSDNIELLKEFAFDFDNDDFLLDDNGNFIIVDGLEALKVRNYLILRTYKNRFFIFQNNGSKIKDLIGKSYEFILENSKSIIEDALLDKKYVKSIENLEVKIDESKGNKAIISFTVNTIYGSYDINSDGKVVW